MEDEADTRELITQILEQQGAATLAADSYRSALELLTTSRPDVFLIDIGMPEQNGYALIAKIRSMPPLRAIPAVAVTAYATETDREIALASGFQAHVAKPFDPTDLVAEVLRLVKENPPQKRRA